MTNRPQSSSVGELPGRHQFRRSFVGISVFVALSFSSCAVAFAQTPPAQTQASEALAAKRQAERIEQQRFMQLMAAAGIRVDANNLILATPNYQAISIQWKSPAGNTRTVEEHLQTQPAASILETSFLSGALPRQRSLALASDQLLVVTVKADAQLRWWTTIPDPRILRSEGPGPGNQISGEVIQLKEVDFVVNIPEDASAAELRFYHPRWNGTDFEPVLINTLALVRK